MAQMVERTSVILIYPKDRLDQTRSTMMAGAMPPINIERLRERNGVGSSKYLGRVRNNTPQPLALRNLTLDPDPAQVELLRLREKATAERQ